MVRKNTNIGVPYNPAQYHRLPSDNGRTEQVEIYQCSKNPGRKLLRCVECELLFTFDKNNAKPYVDHRGSKACEDAARKLKQRRIEAQNEAEIQRALEQVGWSEQPAVSEPSIAANTHTAPRILLNSEPVSPSLSSPPILSPEEEDGPTEIRIEFHPAPRTAASAGLSVIMNCSESESELESDEEEEVKPNPCLGQRVHWSPGPVWSTYAFMQHEDDRFAWKPIGFIDDRTLIIRSKKCKAALVTEKEKRSSTCYSCATAQISATMDSTKRRAVSVKPCTPHKFMSMQQLAEVASTSREINRRLRSQNVRLRQHVIRLQVKIEDFRRILMKLGSSDIAGASRILELALERGDSPSVILQKLDAAISGAYRPHGRWTEREYDLAFLVKAFGGPRLLYALSHSEHHFPSESSLRERKPLAQLLVSAGNPTDKEINTNYDNMLGKRPEPEDRDLGQVSMLDGIAIEQIPRWDSARNKIIGFCRKHSSKYDMNLDSYEKLLVLRNALKKGEIHLAKEGAMYVVAPVSARENNYPTPTCLFGVCKFDGADLIADTTRRNIDLYNTNSNGRARHGDMVLFCTDGEASFRAARFLLCLSQDAVKGADILRNLPGMNCRVGPNDLIGCCDPKHVIKRFAQALRSFTLKLEIGDTTLTYQDIRYALSASGVPADRITALLNPQDKQNVPIALELLKYLRNARVQDPANAPPGAVARVNRVRLYAEIVAYFVRPFTDVTMGLAEQVRSLATYAHLVFGLYRRHRQRFMKGALYADSMSIVKAVVLLVARYQSVRATICLYISHIGTDREEGLFSHVRIQDHARNCDILQLGQKSTIAAETNRILNDNPQWYSGHKRREITTSGAEDHVNPASYHESVNLTVGSVDLPRDWAGGLSDASRKLEQELGLTVDWSVLGKGLVDILRPYSKYVGSSLEADAAGLGLEVTENDDEDLGANSDADGSNSASGTADALSSNEVEAFEDIAEVLEVPGSAEEVLGAEMDDLSTLGSQSPNDTLPHSKYLIVDGKRYHKATLVPKLLSTSSSRKVTIRQFRAAGLSLEELIRKTSSLSLVDKPGQSSEQGASQFTNGDLGAFLCRCGDGKVVALAVLEILNFQTGSGGSGRFSVDMKDLALAGTKVVGQIIDLVAEAPGAQHAHWVWSGKYLASSISDDGASGKQIVTIPGAQLYPLKPGIQQSQSGTSTHTWVLTQSQLKDAAVDLWDFLQPDTDEILASLDSLIAVASPKIPYRAGEEPSFVIEEAATILVPKHKGDDEVECIFCGDECKIKYLRNHVGLHILRAARSCNDPHLNPNTRIGPNPCGWCGREGCKTKLKAKDKDRYTILSDCEYHYEKMSYSHASKTSKPQPCTNVPIVCSLCTTPDTVTSKLVPTVWKYDLLYHLSNHHLQPNGLTVPLPPDMIVSSYITRGEEVAIGISVEQTRAFRRLLDFPPSDDKQEIEEELKRSRSDSVATEGNSRSKKRSKKS